jgi:hypothetical protein
VQSSFKRRLSDAKRFKPENLLDLERTSNHDNILLTQGETYNDPRPRFQSDAGNFIKTS